MNEWLFSIHLVSLLSFMMLCLFLGKEALFLFVGISALLANLFVVKQITLFSLTVTASDVFVIGAILATNLIQEYYGKEEAKKALYFSLLFLGVFLVLSKVHLGYIPAAEDQTHHSFVQIFSLTPRLVLSSIAVFFLVQRIDVLFFGFLQKVFFYRFLALRVFFSLAVSQVLDTILFSYFALYGYVAAFSHVVGMSLLVKLLIISLSSGFLSLIKRWLPLEVYGR